MKLNLLPQTVSKGRQFKIAWTVGPLVLVACILASIAMGLSATARKKNAEDSIQSSKDQYLNAVATSQKATDIVTQASQVIRDANLAKAMIDHNDVYPDLYNKIRGYIPGYFRVTSMSAQPVDGTNCTVTLVGTLGSYQEYADLVLALMRCKDVTSIGRAGYTYDRAIVPGISEQDPLGRPRKPSQPPIPDDQLQRLAYLQSQVRSGGYQNVSNFGSGTEATKGAMPSDSLVTVTLSVKGNLQVPSVESTITAAGGGGGTGGGPGAAGFGGPPGMGGPPGGFPGGPPGAAGGGAPSAGRGAAD